MSRSPGRTEIFKEVEDLARSKLGWEGALEPSMRLVEDLRLDSLRLLTLAMEVEDRFRICLDEDDEAGIATVGELVALVDTKLSASENGEEIRG